MEFVRYCISIKDLLIVTRCSWKSKILLCFYGIVDGICTTGNKIGADGAKAIAAALNVPNGSLSTLNLAANELCGVSEYGEGDYDASGILALAEALKVPNGSLVALDLSYNFVGAGGVADLAEALKVPYGSLGTLDLSANRIGPEGAVALAEALKVPNGSLGTLNLLRNFFGGDGADAIIAVYEQSASLQSLCGCKSGMTSLNLSYRGLEPDDAMLLAAELKKGVTTGSLGTLNLANNPLCRGDGDEDYDYDVSGILALAEALKVPNGSLGTLILDSIRLAGTAEDEHPEGMQALAEALKCNTTLEFLSLQNNSLGPRCASALAACGSLVTLNLGGNKIVPKGAVTLAEALRVPNG